MASPEMLPQRDAMLPSYLHSSKTTGLLPVGAPAGGQFHARVLHAGVTAPAAPVLVLVIAVVDGAQMIERVVVGNNARVAIPVRVGLVLHKVELVGQRPPHIAERAEARNHVAQIAIVHLGRHRLIAPLVVGMKQNQVSLHADAPQFQNQTVEMLKVRRIEGGVVVRFAVARKRIHGRLFAIVLIPLGEQAHAHLVERRCGQRLDGLPLRLLRLKGPRIASGAALDIGRAVRIAEMKLVAHRNRSAIACLGATHSNEPDFAVQAPPGCSSSSRSTSPVRRA